MANTHGFFGKGNDLDLNDVGRQFDESDFADSLLTRDKLVQKVMADSKQYFIL